MRISVTKKLADKLKIDLFPLEGKEDFDELYSWRANVIEDGCCRIVVFMDDASRYTVVLNGIKAKDWSNLPELFTKTLRETLLAEQANPEVVDRYLSEAGKVTYTRNADSQKTAWLNKAGECAGFAFRHHNDNLGLSLATSRALVGTTNGKDMYHPNDRMFELLERYGLPVKKCRAFDLDVHLALRRSRFTGHK